LRVKPAHLGCGKILAGKIVEHPANGIRHQQCVTIASAATVVTKGSMTTLK
jgi:hypothetical protein